MHQVRNVERRRRRLFEYRAFDRQPLGDEPGTAEGEERERAADEEERVDIEASEHLAAPPRLVQLKRGCLLRSILFLFRHTVVYRTSTKQSMPIIKNGLEDSSRQRSHVAQRNREH